MTKIDNLQKIGRNSIASLCHDNKHTIDGPFSGPRRHTNVPVGNLLSNSIAILDGKLLVPYNVYLLSDNEKQHQ